MPRVPNYRAEKRARELKRAARQEAKRQERLRRKQEELPAEPPQAESVPLEGVGG